MFGICSIIVNIMRRCTVCYQTKTKEEYYFRDKTAGTLHSQCRDCYKARRNESWEEHYKKYGDKYRMRAIKRNKILRENLRRKMLAYLKNKSCVKCGIDDIRVLEFDHIYPETKTLDIARAITNTVKWEAILKEIHKCQILCANCHKIKTAKQNNWYRNTIV